MGLAGEGAADPVADGGEDEEEGEGEVEGGVVGDPTGEGDEEHAGGAPGEAHHEGGDGAGLLGGEFLGDDDVDGDGEEENEAAEGECGDAPGALVKEEEVGHEGGGIEKRGEDDAAGAEALGEVAADEAAEAPLEVK